MPKIPVMKRQVAFADFADGVPFTKCCVCTSDDFEDGWIPVSCNCHLPSLYAHPICLKNIPKCDICYDDYERRQIPTEVTESDIVEVNKMSISPFIIITCVLVTLDIVSCISIDRVEQQELGYKIESNYVLLPRFHKKQFQVVKTTFFVKVCVFLILLFIRYRK